MDLGAFFLILLVLLAVATFVIWPFARHWRGQIESNQEVSTLLAERDRILNAIQELDFDNSLGKIPAGEYPGQRKALLQAGADVLRQLDARNQPIYMTEGARAEIQEKQGVKALTEAVAVAAYSSPTSLLSDEDIEELIAKRRAVRKEKTGGFCPKCGKPFLQSDQFCACCGQPVGLRS